MKKNNFVKTGILILLISAIPIQSLLAQEDKNEYKESCTSIMVGKDASTDGSVMTSHTCDAYYRTWLEFVPAKENEPGTKHPIYWGTVHTHTAWSREKLEFKGEIPEADKTFAYLNTAYPCLNEKQLAIGETTFGGRRELRNKEGLFLIEELERIALQRCTTARHAIKLIGELIKEYGYADGGECITIADPHEVWQMEILGEGPDKIGGVWAAQRIPDDHVGIAANICRIGEIDLNKPDYFMASDNVFKVAKKMKYWDGKKPFKFWESYSGRKPFSIREYFVLSSLAPSLHLDFEAEELPFSVKPEKKVDIREILKFFRTTYEGTEWEMTKNLKITVERKDENDSVHVDTIISPSAHPWLARDKRKMLNSIKPDVVIRHRPIAVQYCAYSWIVQLRDWLPDEIGGLLWFGFDVPRESPRIPIYAGNLDLPKSFSICGQDHFSRESAVWAFRRANRLAMVKWGEGKKIIEPVVKEFENKAFNEIDFVEKRALELLKKDEENVKNGIETQLCREFLTRYSNDFARVAIDRWWELGDELWVKFRWSF
ncbi:MAG: C69 family dipeptidase [Bacteroidales bacterium]|nr:C69 family dipeptidase [Bacteroidales bacterium]